MIYYSKSTGGFYDPKLHSVIPDDAVELSKTDYQELLNAQAQGCTIIASDTGSPVAVSPDISASPTAEDIRTEARRRLQSTDWYVTRMAETGEAIPLAISDYRTAVRSASNGMEPEPPTDYRNDANWPETVE